MAKDTPMQLRREIIYQIFPRNYSEEGTFRAIEADLPRIKELGVDIIYLTPIHPIGIEGHKGALGCPYANRDYRTVNPEQGTLEDFIHLVNAVHTQGMRIIIDVVYNHTSPDSVLRHEHPEFFYHRKDGSFGNRFGDWADVIDLDYSDRGLWAYQIETLKYWSQYVDGFRCDVASLVPLELWKQAREACAQVKPGLIWLGETVYTSFNCAARREGLHPFSDSEGYEAFDIEYPYEIWEQLEAYRSGKRPLHEWTEALNAQEALYPENYVKLCCLENHDQQRIASFCADDTVLANWHAFLFMMKGTVMLYAGEEFSAKHLPSLFDKDVMSRDGKDISGYLKKLIRLRKESFPENGWFSCEANDETESVCVKIGDSEREYCGLFSLNGKPAEVQTELSGEYTDLLSGNTIRIENGLLRNHTQPIVIRVR